MSYFSYFGVEVAPVESDFKGKELQDLDIGRSRSQHRQAAFTLVELLVVIAIIGVLVALLLPAVQAARDAARRTSCANNLRQLGLALHNHHDTVGKFPGSTFYTQRTPQYAKFWGWLPRLLPYMEQAALHEIFDFNQLPQDSGNSRNLLGIQTPWMC